MEQLAKALAQNDLDKAKDLVGTTPELVLYYKDTAALAFVVKKAKEFKDFSRPADRDQFMNSTSVADRRHSLEKIFEREGHSPRLLDALMFIGNYIAQTSIQSKLPRRRRGSYNQEFDVERVAAKAGSNPNPKAPTHSPKKTVQPKATPPRKSPNAKASSLAKPMTERQRSKSPRCTPEVDSNPEDSDTETSADSSDTDSDDSMEDDTEAAINEAVQTARAKIQARQYFKASNKTALHEYMKHLFHEDPEKARRLLRYLFQQSLGSTAKMGKDTARDVLRQMMSFIDMERSTPRPLPTIKKLSLVASTLNAALVAHIVELLVDVYIADFIQLKKVTLSGKSLVYALAIRASDSTDRHHMPLEASHADVQRIADNIASLSGATSDPATIVTRARNATTSAQLESGEQVNLPLCNTDGPPAAFGSRRLSLEELVEMVSRLTPESHLLSAAKELLDTDNHGKAKPALTALTPIIKRMVNVIKESTGLRADAAFMKAATLCTVHSFLPKLVATIVDRLGTDRTEQDVITPSIVADAVRALHQHRGNAGARPLAPFPTSEDLVSGQVPPRILVELLYSEFVTGAQLNQVTDRSIRNQNEWKQTNAQSLKRQRAETPPLDEPARPKARRTTPHYTELSPSQLERLIDRAEHDLHAYKLALDCVPENEAKIKALEEKLPIFKNRLRELTSGLTLASGQPGGTLVTKTRRGRTHTVNVESSSFSLSKQ
jgi:hypothetical protein